MAPLKISVGARLLSCKVKLKPQLCKFLGVPLVSPRGEIPVLISKFLKLYHPQSPGIKKDKIWEENLKAILHGKEGVGMSEINKILSPQFNDPSLRNKEMERQKDIRVVLSELTNEATSCSLWHFRLVLLVFLILTVTKLE